MDYEHYGTLVLIEVGNSNCNVTKAVTVKKLTLIVHTLFFTLRLKERKPQFQRKNQFSVFFFSRKMYVLQNHISISGQYLIA